MKKSKIFLNDIETNNICNTLRENTSLKIVTTYYEVAALYNLQSLSKDFLCYIERFFTVVAETENFLHLSFVQLSKILSSSEVISSEELESILNNRTKLRCKKFSVSATTVKKRSM